MAVRCQQLVDGEAIDAERDIPPPAPGMTDADILAAKAASAADKGWDVEWLGPAAFVARRVRWSPDQLCERIFRVVT